MRVINVFVLALMTMQAAPADESARSRGVREFGEGHYAAALQDLRTAVEQQPDDNQAVVFLALTKAATGDCQGAHPVLITAAEKSAAPLDRMAGLAAAKCDSVRGDAAQASSILERLQTRYPNDADVLYLSAKIHMKAFNDATFAMFQRAPASFRVHELSAEIFEVQNRFAEAVGEYRKAIELNPKAPDLHYRLGRALMLQGHSAELMRQAAGEFRTELERSPEDSASEYQLGQIAEAQGNEPEALTHFERASSLSPNFVQALIALGRIYSHGGQTARAITLLKRATDLQPENEAAHYGLMSAYRAAGELDRAKDEKRILDRLQKQPEGEFSEFLKKLGGKQSDQ